MQGDNSILDQLANLMTNAAGAAKSVRDEIASIVRSQAERLVDDLDFVQREEFDALKAMHARSRKEVEELRARLAVLETTLVKNDSRDSRLFKTPRNSPIRSQSPKRR